MSTKAEIHARINAIHEIVGLPTLAAYKAKDMTSAELNDLLLKAELELEDFNQDRLEENDGKSIEFAEIDAADEAEDVVLDPETTERTKRGARYNENGDRRCGCCGNYFPPSAFGEYKRSKDGLASYTKEHTSAYRAKK